MVAEPAVGRPAVEPRFENGGCGAWFAGGGDDFEVVGSVLDLYWISV